MIKNKDTGIMMYLRLGQSIDVRNIKHNSSRQQDKSKETNQNTDWQDQWSFKRGINIQFINLCQTNQPEKCVEYIKNKTDIRPDINTKDSNGNSPLHIAVSNGNSHLVSFLLYHEAVIDSINS